MKKLLIALLITTLSTPPMLSFADQPQAPQRGEQGNEANKAKLPNNQTPSQNQNRPNSTTNRNNAGRNPAPNKDQFNQIKPMGNDQVNRFGNTRPVGQHSNRSRDEITSLATIAVIGGLTYYILDNIYYQRYNNNYVIVQSPVITQSSEPTQIDYQGKRYYVKDNRFYVRDISGTYIEVARPVGL